MSIEPLRADVIVIGGGIAGAGVAAELAGHRRVVVLEREAFPGYHATGRSAALFSEIYGGAVVRALGRASRAFYRDPPQGFASSPLMRPRGLLIIANEDERAELQAFAATSDVVRATRPLSAADALALCPILRPAVIRAAIIEDGAHDIEVDLLHQGWLRALRAKGGQILTDQEAIAIERAGDDWRIETRDRSFAAPVVVNAAGAWADEVARLAGARPLGLQPKKRTAVLVDSPPHADIASWPLVMDVDETFYFKPDAGRLLLSPADETPSPPSDVVADQMDVAVAIDHVQQFADLDVRRVVRSWAGLRTFAPDRTPVAGYDPRAAGFFWLAGQGGFGIQTVPALSRAAAALIAGRSIPEDILAHGLEAPALSPARFG